MGSPQGQGVQCGYSAVARSKTQSLCRSPNCSNNTAHIHARARASNMFTYVRVNLINETVCSCVMGRCHNVWNWNILKINEMFPGGQFRLIFIIFVMVCRSLVANVMLAYVISAKIIIILHLYSILHENKRKSVEKIELFYIVGNTVVDKARVYRNLSRTFMEKRN